MEEKLYPRYSRSNSRKNEGLILPASLLTYRYLKGTVAASVSLSLIGLLIFRSGVSDILSLMERLHGFWLLGALSCVLALPFFATLRWYGVLSANGQGVPPLGILLRASLIASFLNSFLPGKAGEFVKPVFLSRYTGSTYGISTVIMERCVDLIVLGGLGILGFFLGSPRYSVWIGALLILLVFLTFILSFLLVSTNYKQVSAIALFGEFSVLFSQILVKPKSLTLMLIGSLGNWLMGIGVVVCLMGALGHIEHWRLVAAAYPGAIIAGLLPVTISGIGVRDAVFVELLQPKLSFDEATFVALGYTSFVYWGLSLISLPIVGGQISLLIRHYLRRPTEH